MMRMLAKERAQKLATEEKLRQTQALLDAASSFSDQNRQNCAEVALQSLCQNGTVSAYTQEFNSHARTVGWADTPLMSLYQHRLKENVQLAVVELI
ncbi:uncharacterized protein VP01_765g1 [Puccinia sorghi]|uniref:Retrotransposon gag domain-containing protein n=1 Tax=Puccinia sorghi TaxID=27349 RepID=A0A0L6UBN4_9BASI|nr:uncharacterized protein VP01_765g1 [Puccinia sorghi]